MHSYKQIRWQQQYLFKLAPPGHYYASNKVSLAFGTSGPS